MIIFKETLALISQQRVGGSMSFLIKRVVKTCSLAALLLKGVVELIQIWILRTTAKTGLSGQPVSKQVSICHRSALPALSDFRV